MPKLADAATDSNFSVMFEPVPELGQEFLRVLARCIRHADRQPGGDASVFIRVIVMANRRGTWRIEAA